MAIIQATPTDEDLDRQVEDMKNHILSNQPEMEDFIGNASVASQLAQLIVLHWGRPTIMGVLIKQQLNSDLDYECTDKVREGME